jgi:hypothetical protein
MYENLVRANNRIADFFDLLKERSHTLNPDYPWRDEIEGDPFDMLHALTASIEGTNAANSDMHEFIKFLSTKYNFHVQNEWKQFAKSDKGQELGIYVPKNE